MDGPVRLGQRSLSIEFKSDRHAQNRIELAYRRLETLATADTPPEDSVQVAQLGLPTPGPTASEIQG